MTTLYTIMSYGGIVLAVISLAAAIILFIKWDIPKIFGDITGQTEKKTIQRIQREGYEANASKQTAIKKKQDTGRIQVRKSKTETLKEDALPQTQAKAPDVRPGMEEKADKREITNKLLHVYKPKETEETTTVLHASASDEEVTTVLQEMISGEETTTVLSGAVSGEEVTTVLSGNTETIFHATEQVLQEEEPIEGVIRLPGAQITDLGTVVKVLDFMITHTDEEII